MALAKEEKISSIVDSLFSAGKKDKAIIVLKLNALDMKELDSFQAILARFEGIEEKKADTKPKKLARCNRDGVLDKIKRKLEENESSGVKIRTGAILEGLKFVAKDLEGETKEDIIERWGKLDQAVENLTIAKAMMQFEQGRLIFYLSLLHSMSLVELAQKFGVTKAKVSEHDAFYRFCKKYPALLFSSYTMGTLIKFKSDIEKLAAVDERFLQLLELQQETVELYLEDGRIQEQVLTMWFNEDVEADLLEKFLDAGETIPSEEPNTPARTDIIILAKRDS